MADLNCCPTEADVSNARRNPTFLSIRTGNTIVDALDRAAPASEVNDNNYILLSLHRREMYYECGSDFLSRVAEVLILNSDLELLILSRNPNQTSDFMDRFKGQHRVRVVPPLPHAAMLGLTQNARCVVTDSGGLLEEATLLGRPVIVIRESVEGSRIKYADRVHPASAEQDLPTALQKALTLLGPSSARYESSETALLARIEWGDGNAARQIVDAIGMIKARGPDAE
jgi:UDP-N-acetylglucosamine 2-epimerase (non-hydrolysing)